MPADFSGGYRRLCLGGAGGPLPAASAAKTVSVDPNPTTTTPAEPAGSGPPIMAVVPADPKNRRQRPTSTDRLIPADQCRRTPPALTNPGGFGHQCRRLAPPGIPTFVVVINQNCLM